MDIRSELETVHADLSERITALRSGADVPSGGISFGKRVGEGTSIAIERFADVAVHDQLVQQLAAVEVALQRLDDGTYGTCEKCEQPIADERLEAVPWASRCVRCA
ncbi:MAG: TraR/DksA family transcriptional regulator [Ilumatobacteraceae bacterium]